MCATELSTQEIQNWSSALRRVCREVREQEPLRKHVSFRIGGPADLLVTPRSIDELRAVAKWLLSARPLFTVLGQGSNVLIADAGIRGIVVKIGKGVDQVQFDGPRVTAGAGTGLPHLARLAAARGFSGLEFAAGIPASLGGGVVMNAGAHGHAMQDVVRTVRAVTLDGERVFTAGSLGYAYRTSVLQTTPAIVLEAMLELRPSDPATVMQVMDQWLRQRSATQPIGPPSSGCVFRNPPHDHAGRLIDAVGGKGLEVGGAQVSAIHANYIINTGEATAADVVQLMDKVSALVAEKAGVRLEPEIKLLGAFAPAGT